MRLTTLSLNAHDSLHQHRILEQKQAFEVPHNGEHQHHNKSFAEKRFRNQGKRIEIPFSKCCFHSRISSTHHDSATMPIGPPVIYVSHGCLLLPVAVLLWYYWTKRFARKIVRGLLTASSPASNDTVTGGEMRRYSRFASPHRDSLDLPPPLGCGDEFSSW